MCRLMEALERHLDYQEHYQETLQDLEREMAVCKRSLAKSQVWPGSLT